MTRIFSRTLRILFAAGLLLITAQRLPAPISEVPETPTPTPVLPTQSENKSNATITGATPQPAANPAPSTTPEVADPARFAGTWTGKIKFGRVGDVDFTLVINSEATSLEQGSKNFGRHMHATISSGHTLSWRAGEKNDLAWTLTPNPDGQTALTTLKLPSGAESTAIFQRVQASSNPSPTPARKLRPGTKAKRPSAY